MRRKSTLKDVATAAGVGQATASYVLNNSSKSFSPGTRERVFQAARTLSYQPNIAARTLATQRSHAIALWIANAHAPFFAQVIYYLQREARLGGYETIIREMAGDPDQLPSSSQMSSWPVDGIIAFQGAAYVQAFLKANPVNHLPLVSVGEVHEQCSDFITIDLASGASQAMQHLLENSRRVAFLVPAAAKRPGESRHDAYLKAVTEAGCAPEYILTQSKQRAEVRQVIRGYIAQAGCPQGIFCYNDDMALGAYRGLCDLGLRVPEEVALVGCDGIEDTEYLETPLSTIIQPVEEMCTLAWQFLQKRMQEPNLISQQGVVTAELAIRASSAQPSLISSI
jgi:DNA-binding LacI/PurR family transcriptional regulator